MDLNDLHYAPKHGGKYNSGRQAQIGYSVWRKSDHKFLDAVTGHWSDTCKINPMIEQGRDFVSARFKQDNPALRGVYLPKGTVNVGTDVPTGVYVVFYHDTESDNVIVGEEHRYYAPPPQLQLEPPKPEPFVHEPTLLASGAILVSLLILSGLERR